MVRTLDRCLPKDQSRSDGTTSAGVRKPPVGVALSLGRFNLGSSLVIELNSVYSRTYLGETLRRQLLRSRYQGW